MRTQNIDIVNTKISIQEYANKMVKEYISEAEHMDGLSYWTNSDSQDEVLDHFVYYLQGNRALSP
jgi:hypothetical protein